MQKRYWYKMWKMPNGAKKIYNFLVPLNLVCSLIAVYFGVLIKGY